MNGSSVVNLTAKYIRVNEIFFAPALTHTTMQTFEKQKYSSLCPSSWKVQCFCVVVTIISKSPNRLLIHNLTLTAEVDRCPCVFTSSLASQSL